MPGDSAAARKPYVCASAVEAMGADAPELVLLDVETPELSGLDVLDRLGDAAPAVVFVTAYDHYAVRAFDLYAVDYVLKPIRAERLKQALDRARRRLDLYVPALNRRLLDLLRPPGPEPPAEVVLPGADPAAPVRRLSVHGPREWTLLDVAEIDWIEGAGVYARPVTATGVHLIREMLSNLEARLDAAVLLRVQRSLIVNVARIRHVHPRGMEGNGPSAPGAALRGAAPAGAPARARRRAPGIEAASSPVPG